MPVLSLRPQLGAAPAVDQALPYVFVELDLGNLVSGAILDDPLTAQLEGVVVPPFVPTDIVGLQNWYDFSDATTLFTDAARTTPVSSDGQTIKGIGDKSSGAFHLASIGANGPLYKVAIANSKSIGRFDAARADGIGSASFAASQPDTMFVVTAIPATAAQSELIDGATGRQIMWVATATSFASMHAASTLTSAVAPDNGVFRIWVGVFNGASSKLYIDGGAAAVSGNAGAGALASGRIGADNVGANKLTGDIAEFLIYSSALSLADINTIGDYLAIKWAVTWTTAT